MRPPRLPRAVAAVLAGSLLAGCATLTGDTSPGLVGVGVGDIAARAGDAVVTVDQLAAEVEAAVEVGALDSEEFSGSELERRLQLQTRILNIEFLIALLQEAAREDFGIEITDEEVDELVEQAVEAAGGLEVAEEQLAASGQTLRQFRQGQRIARLRQAVTEALLAEDPLTEEDVAAALEERAGQFEQVRASHILVETREQAEQVLERLEAGEDFADLARELSQDPGSAEAGGDLGLTPRGTFVEPFEDAIWEPQAEPGEVLGPVETQFGFHVIRVEEFQVTSEDEAREQVRAELETTRGDELFGIWFQQVRADADPEVQGRLGRWSDTQQTIVRDDEPAQPGQSGQQ